VLRYQPMESALRRPPARGPVGFGLLADADLVAIKDGESFETLLSTTFKADCKGVPTPKPP